MQNLITLIRYYRHKKITITVDSNGEVKVRIESAIKKR